MNRKELISRLRNTIKEVHGDSEYSNRYLWHILTTCSKQLIKQDADKGKIFKQSSIWETICIKMEPVSSLICNCTSLPYDCIVYRSVEKLPEFFEYSNGIVYRFIATPDLSQQFTLVSPYQYQVKSKIKFNKRKYAFIHDGYLYTPADKYPYLAMSSLFNEDVAKFKCEEEDTDENNSNGGCNNILDLTVPLPDYLKDACIKMALQELGMSKQIMSDQHPNANENQKEVSP